MSYYSNLRTLATCQDRYDNMLPPEYYQDDRIPDGCSDDDYDDWDGDDDWDGVDGYDGILGEG